MTQMDSLELKNILIHRISEINDIAFLKALKTILDSKADTKVLQLSPEQRGANHNYNEVKPEAGSSRGGGQCQSVWIWDSICYRLKFT